MPTVSKSALSSSLGLPTRQDLLLQKGQADTVPATIHDPVTGEPKGNAMISEGEFVFSVPAIIALGQGDYDKGLSILTELHNKLRDMAPQFIEGQGLGAAE